MKEGVANSREGGGWKGAEGGGRSEAGGTMSDEEARKREDRVVKRKAGGGRRGARGAGGATRVVGGVMSLVEEGTRDAGVYEGSGRREAGGATREAGRGRREEEGGRLEEARVRKEAGASGAANAGCTDTRGADAPACARENACWGGGGGCRLVICFSKAIRGRSERPRWHLLMLGMPGPIMTFFFVTFFAVECWSRMLDIMCSMVYARSAHVDHSRSNRGMGRNVPQLRAEL